jgi:hypothetical protein
MTEEELSEAWESFTVALETGIQQPGMDATWAYEKGDSKRISITGDNGKLIIYMSKREGGKLVYEYCTLPNEISISKTADVSLCSSKANGLSVMRCKQRINCSRSCGVSSSAEEKYEPNRTARTIA